MRFIKYSKCISYLLLFFIFSIEVMGQEITKPRKTRTGKIYDEFTSQPITDVSINNESTYEQTINDLNGIFKINADENDSLKITLLQSQSTETILVKDYLKSDSILIPFISDNINNIIVYGKKSIKKELTKPISPRHQSALGAVTSLNIISILNRLNGTYRKEKSLYKYQLYEYYADKIIEVLDESFFTEELQMPENEINNFLFFVISTNISQIDSLLKNAYVLDLMKLLTQEKMAYDEKQQ